MKKRITLILLAAISLYIAACSSTSEMKDDNPQTSYNISDEMSAEEKYTVIADECIGFLQIKINPEFELYIAAEEGIGFVVVDARPLNEDAETVLKKISLSNMTLWDAMFTICEAAEDKGFLDSDSNIKMEYYGVGEGHNPAEVIADAMNEYQRVNNISFLYDTVCTEISIPEEDSTEDNENLAIDDSLYDLVERDADGNVIKTVYTNKEDNCIETYTYDANGTMLSKIFEDINFDQTHEEYYENEVLVKKVSIYEGGSVTQTFDKKGNMTSEINDDEEGGSYSEIYWTYYEDGSKASSRVKLIDSYYTNGYYKEETYYQGSAVSMSYEVSQYGDNKFYYDASGNPTQYEGKDSDGNRVETVYNSDGSYVTKVFESNGNVRVENWGEDGSLETTYE